ncbi:MAG: GNAT family N-acetyltransferase [Stellaceae bacterium]
MTGGTADRLAWRVEETCFNAFPSLEQVYLGGWLLRFSPGGPRRAASSINPLRPDCDTRPELLDAAAALYRRRGMPALFRLPSFVAPEVEQSLAARGYGCEGESCVIYGDIGALGAASGEAVRLSRSPSAGWFAAMSSLQRRGAEQSAVYSRILRAIAVPIAFAELRVGSEPAALAYGIVHDRLLCYESVITSRCFRRQGLARRVIAALAAWGRDNGAAAACLQVETDNAPARALYHGFGLTSELYRYHYRRAPADRS